MSKESEFYDQIAKDAKQSIIQLVSEAGHGKSSSLRTIIYYCQEKHPDLVFKIMDVSLAWYHCAPVKYRQYVTQKKVNKGEVANIENCVYEMGSMTQDQQRAFVGEILKQDYMERYLIKLKDEKALKKLPFIIYVFEEANIYFGSYALRTNDQYSPIFQKYVSVGRNYRMRGFLVATAEVGEISPSLRRRSRRIYGRVESEGDLSRLRKKDKKLADYIASEIPRYTFVYYGSEAYGPVKIPDLVKNVPIDYVVPEKPQRVTVAPVMTTVPIPVARKSKPASLGENLLCGAIGALVLIYVLNWLFTLIFS